MAELFTVSRAILPDCSAFDVIHEGADEAAFTMTRRKKEYVMLAVAVSGEDYAFYIFQSTHMTPGENVLYNKIEQRFQVLYDFVKQNLRTEEGQFLSSDMQIGALTQKAVVGSTAGDRYYIIQYIEKQSLFAYRNGKSKLKIKDGPLYVVDKALTSAVKKAYDRSDRKKKVLTVLLILFPILAVAVTLGIFLLLGRGESEPEPKEILLANLCGEKIEVAAAYLNECGIGYTYVEEVNEDAEKGIVIAQSVRAYSTVLSGTSIVLTVSSGKDYIVSVTLDTLPARMDYCIGDTFDFSGMKLRAIFNSGAEKVISSGFTYSPQTASKGGEQAVVVSYGENSCVLNVTVAPVEMISISIYRMPDLISYKVGERLDPSGLKITANMSNGTTKVVERGFTCEPEILTSSGEQVIVVTYEGKRTQFTVTVSD